VSLGKTLKAVSHFGAKQSTLCGWPSLTKGMQTEQLLCCSGVTDTEHSTTSSSNDEEDLMKKN